MDMIFADQYADLLDLPEVVGGLDPLVDEHQDFLQDSELERLDFSDSVFTPPLSEGTTSAADCSISAVSQDPALPMNVSLPVPMQCFPSPASKAFGPGQQMYMASQAVATAATGAHSSAGALQHPSRTPSLASSQCEASHQSPAEPWADNDSLCSSQMSIPWITFCWKIGKASGAIPQLLRQPKFVSTW